MPAKEMHLCTTKDGKTPLGCKGYGLAAYWIYQSPARHPGASEGGHTHAQ